MLCNTDSAQDAQTPSFLHPHDPSIEQEYETLIRAWKHQLIGRTPPTPSNDYIRFAWMRLMDHYLDQQWLDSKQMMQCAQAWSARESISLTEAVHTMNILSLKSMQRSLDTRQELLQALGDPDFMVGFGVSPIKEEDIAERFSLAGSEDQEEDDDEQVVYAPLFVKHNTVLTEEILDEAIITTENTQEDELIRLYNGQEDEEVKSRSTYQEDTVVVVEQRSRLTSSSSTPNISLTANQEDTKGIARKYESYYQQLHQASSWKEISINHDDDEFSDNDSLCSASIHSDANSPPLGSGVQWKSWFLEEQNDQTAVEQPLLGINHMDDNVPIIFEEDFADQKVETDASFSGLYADLMPTDKKTQPFLMVRSESSISAFRPISNNLAPRCQPTPRPIASSYPLQRSSSSYSGLKENLMMPSKSATTTTVPTITKSKSFPSKAALTTSVKKSYASSPPPMPQKERNFMIRSIVSKKASLSKLFSSRKLSSSSASSSAQ